MSRLANIAAAGAVLLVGRVLAQPAPTETVPSAAPAPRPVTVDEARVTGERLQRQIRATMLHVKHLQTVARKDKDAIKLSCVNDRLINLKAQANVFELAQRDLLESIDAAEARQKNHARVVDAANAMRRLREEADACVGQPEMAVERGNEYTRPTVTDDPTGALPFDITIETPGYASPFI